MNVGSYAVRSPTLGWLCFLCSMVPAQPAADEPYVITARDSFRVRAYLGELGLWLEMRTAELSHLRVDPKVRMIVGTVVPPPGGWLSSRLRIRLSTPALPTGRRTAHAFTVDGAHLVRGSLELDVDRSLPNTSFAIRWEA